MLFLCLLFFLFCKHFVFFRKNVNKLYPTFFDFMFKFFSLYLFYQFVFFFNSILIVFLHLHIEII